MRLTLRGVIVIATCALYAPGLGAVLFACFMIYTALCVALVRFSDRPRGQAAVMAKHEERLRKDSGYALGWKINHAILSRLGRFGKLLDKRM